MLSGGHLGLSLDAHGERTVLPLPHAPGDSVSDSSGTQRKHRECLVLNVAPLPSRSIMLRTSCTGITR